VQLWHAAAKTGAAFDDASLVSAAGLVPIMRLAQRCGLAGLVGERVSVDHRCGANAPYKIGSIVDGMAAGADSIDDLDVIRHGGMDRLFDGIRAPSTLGSFLRAMSWGNARQVEKVSRGDADPAGCAHAAAARRGHPGIPGHRLLAEADLRAGQAGRRVRPHQDPRKECAGARVEPADRRGLDAAGSAGDLRHPVTRRHREHRPRCGLVPRRTDHHRPRRRLHWDPARARGLRLLHRQGGHRRRRAGVRFSITARMDRKIRRAIATIPEQDWTPTSTRRRSGTTS
jgi:hypothetical protein